MKYMFRPAAMQKVGVIISSDHCDRVVDRLHTFSNCEIVDISDKIKSGPLKALLVKNELKEEGPEISRNLLRARRILDLFNSAKPKKEKSIIAQFIGVEDKKRVVVTEKELKEKVKNATRLLDAIEEKTKPLEAQMEEIDDRINDLRSNLELLETLALDIDLEFLREGKYTKTFIGFVEKPSLLREEMHKHIKHGYFVHTTAKEERTFAVVVILKEDIREFEKVMRIARFSHIDIPDMKGKPSHLIEHIKKEIKQLEEKRKEVIGKILRIAKRYEQELDVLYDVLELEVERSEIRTWFGRTHYTTYIEAWVPSKKYKAFEHLIMKETDGQAVIRKLKPDEGEEPPVLLDNPKPLKPFEMLTNMYAPPKYGEIDPTPMLAPMFLIYFGLMLTDTVYGIILSALGLLLYLKTKGTIRDLAYILTWAGLFTIIFGVLTGGYLGTVGVMAYNALTGSNVDTLAFNLFGQTLDPIKNPILILEAALVVGALHLTVGLMIGAFELIRKGNLKQALLDKFSFLFLMYGAVVYAMTPFQNLGMLMMLLALALFIYNEKALGMMNVTGMLGDVLSYSRLLALALATGGIALTVNILTQIVWDLPYIGILIGIIVFIAGHTFNFVMNALGSFIHSLRLHYVEFFSKFYESGGELFSPFSIKTKHVVIK
ncbi:MAG: V-type ATP synthase subunit I [Candidatus Diapherotrites archaeon]|nr:V-type ATP synthase subunit I [Candidatus Diapherotrites archaeon]